MKLKLIINSQKHGTVTWPELFNSQEELDAKKVELELQGHWGKYEISQPGESYTNPDTNEVTETPPVLIPATVSFSQEDVTAEEELRIGLITRHKEIVACEKVIELVGHLNKFKPQGTVTTVLSSPQMQGVIFALLTGAPVTAKAAIISLGTSLYTQEEINQVTAILDEAIV